MVFFLKAYSNFKSLYKTHGATIQMKPLQQFFRTLPFDFLYFTKRNLVCFSRLVNGRNARVIHNYCENNKFKEIFHFVKIQNSKKQGSIAAVLSRLPCLIFADRFTTFCRPRCGAAVRILIPLVKGRGILQNAECRMALFSEGQKTMLSCCLRVTCILRTMPLYVLRSAKYSCRMIKVTKPTVLSPFKVEVTTQECFQLVIYLVPNRATWFRHETSTVGIRWPQHTVYIFITHNSSTHVQTIFPGCYRCDR